MAVSNISLVILTVCLFSQMSFGWIRFRYPYSRRVYMQQTALERLQNCGGLKEKQCGVCGEGPGEIPTSAIPEQNYLPINLDNDMIDIEVAFHADLGGHFEFRLCRIEPDMVESNLKCLETAPLQLIGDRSSYYPVSRQTSVRLPVAFPTGTSCDMCLLQVKYTPNKPAEGLGNFTYYDCAPVSLSSPTKQASIIRGETAFPSGRSTNTTRTITVQSSVRGGDNSRVASLLLGRTGGVETTRVVVNRNIGQNINGVNTAGSTGTSSSTMTSSNSVTQTDGQPIRSVLLQNRTTMVVRTEPELNTRRATIHRLVINRNQAGGLSNDNTVNNYQEENLQGLVNNRNTDILSNDLSSSRTTRIDGITFAGDTLSGSRRDQLFSGENNVDGTSRTDVSGVVTNTRVVTRGPTFSTRNISLLQNPMINSADSSFTSNGGSIRGNSGQIDRTITLNRIDSTRTNIKTQDANIESINEGILSENNFVDNSANTNIITDSSSSMNTVNGIDLVNNDINGTTFSRRVDSIINRNQPNDFMTRTTFLTINSGGNGINNEQLGTDNTFYNVNNIANTGVSDNIVSRNTINTMGNGRTITADTNDLSNIVDESNLGRNSFTDTSQINNAVNVDTVINTDGITSIETGQISNSNAIIDSTLSRNTFEITNTGINTEVHSLNDANSIGNAFATNTVNDINTGTSLSNGNEIMYAGDGSMNGRLITSGTFLNNGRDNIRPISSSGTLSDRNISDRRTETNVMTNRVVDYISNVNGIDSRASDNTLNERIENNIGRVGVEFNVATSRNGERNTDLLDTISSRTGSSFSNNANTIGSVVTTNIIGLSDSGKETSDILNEVNNNTTSRTVSTNTVNLNSINVDKNADSTSGLNNADVKTDNTISRLTIIDVNAGSNGDTAMKSDIVNEERLTSENNTIVSNIEVVPDTTLTRTNVDEVITDTGASFTTNNDINNDRTVITTFGRISGNNEPLGETFNTFSNNNLIADNNLVSSPVDMSSVNGRIDTMVNEGILTQDETTFIGNQNNVLSDTRQEPSVISAIISAGSNIGTSSDSSLLTRNSDRFGLNIIDDRTFRAVNRRDSLADVFSRITGNDRTGSVDNTQISGSNINSFEVINSINEPIVDDRTNGTNTTITVNRTITGLRQSGNTLNENGISSTFIDRFGTGVVVDRNSESNTLMQNEVISRGTFTNGLVSTGQSKNQLRNDQTISDSMTSQNNFASDSNNAFKNSLFNEMRQNNVIDTGFVTGQQISDENVFVQREPSSIVDTTYISNIDSTNGSAFDNTLITNNTEYTNINQDQIFQETLFSNETTYINNTSMNLTYDNTLNMESTGGSLDIVNTDIPVTDITQTSMTSDFNYIFNSTDSNIVLENETYIAYDSVADSRNFTLTESSSINGNSGSDNLTFVDTGYADVLNTNLNTNEIPFSDVSSFYEFETTTSVPATRNIINVGTNVQGRFQQEVVSVPNTITVFPINFKTVDPVIPYTEPPVEVVPVLKDRHATVYDNVIISSFNNDNSIYDRMRVQSEIRKNTTEIPIPVNQPVTNRVLAESVQTTTDPFDVYFRNFETTTAPSGINIDTGLVVKAQSGIDSINDRRYDAIGSISYQQQQNNRNGQAVIGTGFDLTQTVDNNINMINKVDASVGSNIVSSLKTNEISNTVTNTKNITVYDNILINRYPSRDISSQISSSSRKDTLLIDKSNSSTDLPIIGYDMPTTTDKVTGSIMVNDRKTTISRNTDQFIGGESTSNTNIPYIKAESSSTSHGTFPTVDQSTTPTSSTRATVVPVVQTTRPVPIATIPSRTIYETPSTTVQFPDWTFADIYSTTTVPPAVDLIPTQTERPISSIASFDKANSSADIQVTNYETVTIDNPNNVYIAGDSLSVVNVTRTVEKQGNRDQYVDLVNNVDIYGGVPITGTNGQIINQGTFFVSSKSGSSNSILQSVDGSSFDVTNSLVPVANRPIVDERTVSDIQTYDSNSIDTSVNNVQSGFIVYNTSSTGELGISGTEGSKQKSMQTVVATDINNVVDSANVADVVVTGVSSNTGILSDKTVFDTRISSDPINPNTLTTSTLENSGFLSNSEFNKASLGTSSSSSNFFDNSQTSVYESDIQNDIKSDSKLPIATSTVWRSIGVDGDSTIINNRVPPKKWKGDVNDPMSYHFFTLVNGDTNTQYLGSQPQNVEASSSVDISNTFDTVQTVDMKVSKKRINGGVSSRSENTSPTLDIKTVNNNLTSSALWDLNRMNNDVQDETRVSTIEYKPKSSVTTVSRRKTETVNPVRVTKTRRYRILLDPRASKTMPPISAKDTQVNIISQYRAINNTEKSSDINSKVLKTLEQLVLELKQNQDTTTISNIPEPIPVKPRMESVVTNGRLYETVNNGLGQIDPINALNVLYVEEGISRGIPPPIIPGARESAASTVSTGTRSRLSNLKAASGERTWTSGLDSSQVSLGAIETLNKGTNTQAVEETIVKQPVIALPRQSGRMYDILLDNFANVSTVNISETATVVETNMNRLRDQQMNSNTNLVETKVGRLPDEQVKTNTNSIETTTNIINVEKPLQVVNNSDITINEDKELLRRQRIIQASEGQISNPFAGTDIRLYNNIDKTLANQLSADPMYREAPQVSDNTISNSGQTNVVGSKPMLKDTKQISIEGKYFVGEMRRNEHGQFEPVPAGADVTLTDRAIFTPPKRASQTVNIVRVSNQINPSDERIAFLEPSKDTIINSNNVNIVRVNNDIKPSNDIKTNFNNKMDLAVESNTNTGFISQDKLISMIKRQKQGSDNVFDTFTTASTPIFDKVRRLPNSLSLSPVPNAALCGQGQRFKCEVVGSHRQVPGMEWWCFSHCKNGFCPEEKCKCACATVQQSNSIIQQVKPIVKQTKLLVKQTKPMNTVQKPEVQTRVKKVINLTLNGSEETMVPVKTTIVSEPNIRKFETKVIASNTELKTLSGSPNDSLTRCRGINAFAGTQGIDTWCTTMCGKNVCPPEICACSP